MSRIDSHLTLESWPDPAEIPDPWESGRDQRPDSYERIKRAIFYGLFEPGEFLTETALAQWCDVSRTPVREALRRLEQDGLVVRKNRGMMVYERGHDEVLELYEVRVLLESTVSYQAALHRSPTDLALMHRVLTAMLDMDEATPVEKARVNAEFHAVIWRASRNRTMIDLLERVNLRLGARYPATTLAHPGRWGEANLQHRALVVAIEAKDGTAASNVARQHFQDARDIRLQLLASE